MSSVNPASTGLHLSNVDALLAAIRAERSAIEGAARRAEDERTLPSDVVALLRHQGLFWLKTPESLGGAELAPTEFAVVLEELAYLDASAAWAVMVGNGCTGTMAGWLPDEGVEEIFMRADQLPIFAGQFAPNGVATRVPGGYRVTGRWGFCSGINHSDWVAGCARLDDESGATVAVAVRTADAERHDTWHAAGLQGTGSADFSLAEVFVPLRHTVDWDEHPGLRGGPLFRQSHVLFVANELSPVVIGIARRAIDDMLEIAGTTSRKGASAALGDRAVFQREIAKAAVTVRSLQLLYRDAVARSWDATLAGNASPSTTAIVLSEHTFVLESCAEVVARIFRYGGGRVLALSHPMQRHLRNLIGAAQHVFVSDENYERAARVQLERRPSMNHTTR